MHNVHAHSFGALMSLVFWFDWLVEILQGGRDWQQQQLHTTNRPNWVCHANCKHCEQLSGSHTQSVKHTFSLHYSQNLTGMGQATSHALSDADVCNFDLSRITNVVQCHSLYCQVTEEIVNCRAVNWTNTTFHFVNLKDVLIHSFVLDADYDTCQLPLICPGRNVKYLHQIASVCIKFK